MGIPILVSKLTPKCPPERVHQRRYASLYVHLKNLIRGTTDPMSLGLPAIHNWFDLCRSIRTDWSPTRRRRTTLRADVLVQRNSPLLDLNSDVLTFFEPVQYYRLLDRDRARDCLFCSSSRCYCLREARLLVMSNAELMS